MPVVAAVILLLTGGLFWARRHPSPFPPALAGLLDNRLRRRLIDPDDVMRQMAIGPGMRVLEIGPGGGMYTAALAERMRGGAFVCLDLQPAMLAKVRARLGGSTPALVCGDITALPLPDAGLDRILMVTVLGEVPDRRGALHECFRVLRPGGTLFIGESLPDPDFIPPRRLVREAEAAGFAASTRTGPWPCYVQAFVRPEVS